MQDGVVVTGIGMYVPSKVVTNEDLIRDFLTTPNTPISAEGIEKTTGIRERRFADGEKTADMAVKSVLEAVGGDSRKIDVVFYVGNAPPNNLDGASCIYGGNLPPLDLLIPEASDIIGELRKDPRFEETSFVPRFGGCAHFISDLAKACTTIEIGGSESAVVVTSTDISRCLDPKDKGTSILFGDGACATVLRKGKGKPRIVETYEGEDTSLNRMLYYERVDGNWYVRMPDGRAVFKTAVAAIEKCFSNITERGYPIEGIDHFIFHQANGRILDLVAKKYGIPEGKLHRTLDRYGNTSSASIGITWHEALKENRINWGESVLLVGFGAGFRWNYVHVQY